MSTATSAPAVIIREVVPAAHQGEVERWSYCTGCRLERRLDQAGLVVAHRYWSAELSEMVGCPGGGLPGAQAAA